MNEQTLIPFDLQRAIAGDKIVTRGGREVVFGGFNPRVQKSRCVSAWVNDGEVMLYYADGGVYGHCISEYDLFMAPKPLELGVKHHRFITPQQIFNIFRSNKMSTETKLIPFDVARAVSGDKVIFRNGETFIFGSYNPGAAEDERVIGWESSSGRFKCYYEDGRQLKGCVSAFDLFMAPKEQTFYYCVFRDNDGLVFMSNPPFKDKSKAEEYAIGMRINTRANLITINSFTIDV